MKGFALFLDCELKGLKDVTDELKDDKITKSVSLKQASGKKRTVFVICFDYLKG